MDRKNLDAELDRLRDRANRSVSLREDDISRAHRKATERLVRLDDEVQKALESARAAVEAGKEDQGA